ncbi:MAG: DnaA N-terminal domain-containing protein, partial [Phycisphaerales bacterium]
RIHTIEAQPACAVPPRRSGDLAVATAAGDADGLPQRILARIRERVGAEGFSRYFAHQARLSVEGGRLSVTVPTGFVAELIGQRFAGPLREAAREELARDGAPGELELRIRVDGRAFGAEPEAPARRAGPAPRAHAPHHPHHPHH